MPFFPLTGRGHFAQSHKKLLFQPGIGACHAGCDGIGNGYGVGFVGIGFDLCVEHIAACVAVEALFGHVKTSCIGSGISSALTSMGDGSNIPCAVEEAHVVFA